MNKTLTTIALAALAALAISSKPAAAEAPSAAPMAKLAYLIGTWDCNWKAGPSSGTNVSTFTPVLDGAWLRETEAVERGGKTVVQTMHFTGYDPSSNHWIHGGPNADGTYEVAESDDLATWKNVLPVAGGTGRFVRTSDTEYVLSEDFQQDGKTMTYVDDCKKRT